MNQELKDGIERLQSCISQLLTDLEKTKAEILNLKSLCSKELECHEPG